MAWICPVCDGLSVIDCERCQGSGWIASLYGLCEAVSVADPGALELVLRRRQTQRALDSGLLSAIRLTRPEHVRLLLDAKADAQAGLRDCVQRALHYSWGLNHAAEEKASILRLLLDSGATVGDMEMKCLDDAFQRVRRAGSQDLGLIKHDGRSGFQKATREARPPVAKKALEAFAEILLNARSKVLSLCVEDIGSESWIIQVHSLGGDRVATVEAAPLSMTLEELQAEIESQASVPCRFQRLVFGSSKIGAQSGRARPIGELLR